MHELLVNRLFKPAQEKVWLGELTVPQDLGRKATNPTYNPEGRFSGDMDHIFFYIGNFKNLFYVDYKCYRIWSRYMTRITCINRLFAYCKGGNFNIHIWAWFGYSICSRREIRFYVYGKELISCLSPANVRDFHENPDRMYTLNSHLLTLKAHFHNKVACLCFC